MNDFINAFIMISGILEFLGIAGGIGFWVFFCFWLYQHRPQSVVEDCRSCGNCQSYKTCVEVMAGDLPDYPCAYWEKKKP